MSTGAGRVLWPSAAGAPRRREGVGDAARVGNLARIDVRLVDDAELAGRVVLRAKAFADRQAGERVHGAPAAGDDLVLDRGELAALLDVLQRREVRGQGDDLHLV